MESWLHALQPPSPTLPPHCDPQGPFLTWLSSTSRTCVPTPLALLTITLGSLSIVTWLFAQMPQVYRNYKLQSTAGLSPYFLGEWLLGDTTNLVGAILTRQATWQIMIASYYTFVDCVMCSQYFYYSVYRKRGVKSKVASEAVGGERREQPPSGGQPGNRSQSEMERSTPRSVPFPKFAFSPFSSSPSPREKGHTPSQTLASPRTITITRPSDGNGSGSSNSNNSSLPNPSPRTLLMISMVLMTLSRASPLPSPSPALSPLSLPSTTSTPSEQTPRQLAGLLISWTSTTLYLISRLPQLLKNARRRSTAGLSLSLFVAAFFGNLFYSASVMANPCAWADFGPKKLFQKS